ncbi:MAG: sulfatase [Gemmatales bacterium]|nr:MAG: sulfatase [Gemmatales bacterium]
MNVFAESIVHMTRRHLLQQLGYGIGALALASLFNEDASGADENRTDHLAPKPSHFPAKAKNVIYIHLVGAPSHLDLFDYKPELQKRDGQLCPDEMFEGKRLAFIRTKPTLLGTPKKQEFAFRRCGRSGITISNLLPHLQTVADEITFIRTMHTDHFNHAPAQMFLLTGFPRFGRPSIGAWATYGLGSANRNLPGFVVLITGQVLGAGNSAWGSGFLPTVYQGVEFRSQGDPVLFLSDPKGLDRKGRKSIVEAVNNLNRLQLADLGDPEIATRIDQYELAFRMQTSVPELMDINSEPKQIHELYGTEPGKTSFANNCLLARRLVERGVRFVQLFDQGWDMHGSVFTRLPQKAKQVDRPIAALIKDLKQRGLLDETLVIWSAEFGRTPMAQGRNSTGQMTRAGRDHHKEAYTVWIAGGGVKRGFVYGKTDDLGYAVAEKPMHVHDFNATLLYLLGMDHTRLTFKHQGRQYRLTDVHGEVAHEIIA